MESFDGLHTTSFSSRLVTVSQCYTTSETIRDIEPIFVETSAVLDAPAGSDSTEILSNALAPENYII